MPHRPFQAKAKPSAADLPEKKPPETFPRVNPNQGQTNQRQVHSATIGHIAPLPLRSILALEFEERFVTINPVQVLEEELHHLLLRYLTGTSSFRVRQRRIAEADIDDSLRTEVENRFDEDEIHDAALVGQGPHQVE